MSGLFYTQKKGLHHMHAMHSPLINTPIKSLCIRCTWCIPVGRVGAPGAYGAGRCVAVRGLPLLDVIPDGGQEGHDKSMVLFYAEVGCTTCTLCTPVRGELVYEHIVPPYFGLSECI